MTNESNFLKSTFYLLPAVFYRIPLWRIYPASKNHQGSIDQVLQVESVIHLPSIIKETAGTLDNLFGYTFPYMMCMHNPPVNGDDTSKYFHFHIEFYPPCAATAR